MPNSFLTPEKIDALLPQTQCGLCSYAGCLPYAKAIVEKNEKINRCPPGGVNTLLKLAALCEQDPQPYLAEMQNITKPLMLAVVREAECIGCTKCIQACPVDAIIGAAKQMHTVINDICTGCELCIAPCPVDCIDMIIIAAVDETTQLEKANLSRQRFQQRQQRLQLRHIEKSPSPSQSPLHLKSEIQAALARAKAKKLSAKT